MSNQQISADAQNVAGLLASCATGLEGLAGQIRSIESMTGSWQDNLSNTVQESTQNIAGILASHAENLQQMSSQVSARAEHYASL